MRFRIGIAVILLVIGLYCELAGADRARGAVLFLTIGPGARAAGMGEAFVAVADDPTATYWNPAGLGKYPLSSRWYDFPVPDTGTQFFAAVRTARADIDFRRFDFWAATPTSLSLLRRDKWYLEETYTVEDPDGMTIKQILGEFAYLKSYDSTFVNTLISKVMNYNKLTKPNVPQDTEIKIPFKYFIPDTITALAGANRALWIGTKNGLYEYAAGSWKKITNNDAPKGMIKIFSVDSKDYLWVGTKTGLFVKKGSRWTKHSATNGLPSSKITAIYAISPRDVWIGTDRGPAHYNGATWKKDFTYAPQGSSFTWESIIDDLCGAKGKQRKNLLVSTLQAYNKVADMKTVPDEIKVPYSLVFSTPITTIYVDHAERVWFGTDIGLVRMDKAQFKMFGWRAESLTTETTIEGFVRDRWENASAETQKKLVQNIRTYGFMNNTKLKAGEYIEYPASPVSGKIITLSSGFSCDDIFVDTEYGLLRYYPQFHQFRYVMSGGLSDRKIEHIENRGGEFLFGIDDEVKVYSQGKPGFSLMHVRWLPELAEDIYYEYLTGVYYLQDWGTVGGAVTFISLGKSDQTTESGEVVGSFYSYETALTASYGAKIFPNLYGGLNFKLIYSALAPKVVVGHEKKSGTGTSFAVDVGLLYDGPIRGLSFGACAQHLGPNIQYIDAAQADPLPRNLKAGFAYRILNTDYQKLTLAGDIDKEIIQFKNPDNTWLLEWHYAVKHIGLEYSYSNFFSLRGGYIIDYDYYPKSDSSEKVSTDGYEYDSGDYISTNYFTFGIGLHYGNLQFDFAYIPKISDPENKGQPLPLSDIKRLSLTVEF
ncbi:PorV/PorQ family protein [bacterium]|nr:PorV/PorQ family protein [bacterium]